MSRTSESPQSPAARARGIPSCPTPTWVTIKHSMSATPVREKQEIGLPVPDFTLPLISGGEQRALAGFLEEKQGAVVLFWSGLCSHCLRYDDYLNRFGERHPELGLGRGRLALWRDRGPDSNNRRGTKTGVSDC